MSRLKIFQSYELLSFSRLYFVNQLMIELLDKSTYNFENIGMIIDSKIHTTLLTAKFGLFEL